MKSAASSQRVMIVEDDDQQRENLLAALGNQNLILEAFSTKADAQQRLKQQLPDLLISDIILGANKDGGFEIARELQSYARPIPIIFLSERQSEFDIMQGHDIGAVDYLPKPVSLAVLQRKVTNILRLTQAAVKVDFQPIHNPTSILNLTLDVTNLKAYWHNQALALTVTEFEMLEQFAQHPVGSVISYQDLQSATQGVVERNTINTHICRLRQAFKRYSPQFDQIYNVYGRGYRWQETE